MPRPPEVQEGLEDEEVAGVQGGASGVETGVHDTAVPGEKEKKSKLLKKFQLFR